MIKAKPIERIYTAQNNESETANLYSSSTIRSIKKQKEKNINKINVQVRTTHKNTKYIRKL